MTGVPSEKMDGQATPDFLFMMHMLMEWKRQEEVIDDHRGEFKDL